MNKLNGRYRKVLEQISDFETRYHRARNSVKLLAVSKKKPADDILTLYECGQRDFAENYLQEALSKISAISKPDLIWHFIGPLQSNKTRLIAEHFSWVHSVDRLKIAERLSNARPTGSRPLNICIQINISDEKTKSGIKLNELSDFARQLSTLPNLKLRGIMGLPRPETDFEAQKNQCSRLKHGFDQLNEQGYALDTLSMGTSRDLEAAISAGSTLVRIGTALFGSRD